MKAQAVRDETVRETARASPLDKFDLGVRDQILDLMISRLGQNDALVKRYLEGLESQDRASEDGDFGFELSDGLGGGGLVEDLLADGFDFVLGGVVGSSMSSASSTGMLS